ncbi:MAG: hypothetical protein HQL96_07670 [Magnetococcales bacterium]|nr:hypothetical protein [Magnetococcales bacterium]
MINLARGIVVGVMLGFALFHPHSWSREVYLAALALVVVVGILIPLEAQDRRLDGIAEDVRAILARLERMESLPVESVAEEMEQPAPFQPGRSPGAEEPFIPAIQSGGGEGRTVMAHGHRTVERSVEDVARKLASMQRGS